MLQHKNLVQNTERYWHWVSYDSLQNSASARKRSRKSKPGMLVFSDNAYSRALKLNR